MNGDKCFELRDNDRGFQKGDYVIFHKVSSAGSDLQVYSPIFLITYVLNGWGLKDGYVAFGITLNNAVQ
jgi:hypothetical protein